MRKTKSRKLSLNKSTVRQLDADNISRAAGASFVLCGTKDCPPVPGSAVACADTQALNCLPFTFNGCVNSFGIASGCGNTAYEKSIVAC